MAPSDDSFTFTVGKLDAGMAILLGENAHLIEFPSILLPPGASTGSIVNIQVNQNSAEEKRRDQEFWALQDQIASMYGVAVPQAPVLKLRNTTQTSVVLEWETLKLATAQLRSLDLYRNGIRLSAIASPSNNTSTKVSSLQLEQDYSFFLVMRTTSGTYQSNTIKAHTHAMSDTSGISVCFGTVEDEILLDNAKAALATMNAKWSDKIQIDTTHFVCTTLGHAPGVGITGNSPGVEYQRALQLSIPVVQPQWVLACHSERKMVQTAQYYLGAATPSTPLTSMTGRPQSVSQTTIQQPGPNVSRQSLPPASRNVPPVSPSSSFVGQSAHPTMTLERTPEESQEGDAAQASRTSITEKRRSRPGTMDRNFKFPSSPPTENQPPPPVPNQSRDRVSATEIPAPPPNSKERKTVSVDERYIEDLGETEEISLN